MQLRNYIRYLLPANSQDGHAFAHIVTFRKDFDILLTAPVQLVFAEGAHYSLCCRVAALQNLLCIFDRVLQFPVKLDVLSVNIAEPGRFELGLDALGGRPCFRHATLND